MATMVVLREPGEVYLQGNTIGPDSVSFVEQIDPVSLEPLARSPDLPGGPFWPGGIAAHANGSLYVTYGRWCHRLGPDCSLLASRELSQPRPYNSLLILPDGNLVMKDLDIDCANKAHLSVLERDRLEPVVDAVEVPEPSISRISADGETVYVIG
ncbi:MAG TPA: hypothetical protein VMQ81_07395, partial [Acidimicrobiia bacterium]|nr:hypothetical protein [Acidimicrobiia bacterium]